MFYNRNIQFHAELLENESTELTQLTNTFYDVQFINKRFKQQT